MKKNKLPYRIPVICGPTAVGKSSIALRLAREFNAEIVSCDSRQIYRFMNIGTAKPSADELRSVRHWVIDCITPDQVYSVQRFTADAGTVIRDPRRRDIPTIICGGTGMYLSSLMNGLRPQVASDLSMRTYFRERLDREGVESLFNELKQCDPQSASILHPNDTQRILRALQVYYKSGETMSAAHRHTVPPDDIEFLVFMLSLPRETLYSRIDRRVGTMMSAGLYEEFEMLCRDGFTESDPGMHCVGYKEFFNVNRKIWSIGEAVEKIRQHSRNYAKRQLTWFKNKVQGIRIDLADSEAYRIIRDKILSFLE